MSAVYNSTVQGFYLSYYGRPADPAGLTFWTGQLAAAGGNLSAILNAFGTSAEATRRYGTGTTESKIQAVYQQTFGRAADAAGLAFYNTEITAGRITLIDMSKRIIDGATGDDVSIRNNRLSAAQSFTDKLDTDAEKAGYSGSGAEDAARSWVATVTKDAATVTAAVATADATITSLLPQTFTLTTSADKWTGSAGNDAVSGATSSLTASDTFQVTDTLDGGAGEDTLGVTVGRNFAGFTTGSMKSVETVNLTNASTTAYTFNATGVSGVKTYNVTGPVNLSALDSLSSGVNLSGVGETNTISVSYADAIVAGTADAATLGLKGGNGAAPSASTSVDPAKVVTLQLNGIERLTTDVSGANYVSFTGGTSTSGISALTVTGESGTFALRTPNLALKSIDASAFKGTSSIILPTSASTNMTSIKTGSGGDIVYSRTGTLVGDATVDLGAGTDTLAVIPTTATTLTAGYTLSGVETLSILGAIPGVETAATNTGSVTLALSANSGVGTISVGNNIAGTQTISGIGANPITVSLAGNSTTSATSQDTTVVIDGHSGVATLTIPVTGSSTDNRVSKDTAQFLVSPTVNVDLPFYAELDTATITASKATSVTISGKGDIKTTNLNIPAATSLVLTQTSDRAADDWSISIPDTGIASTSLLTGLEVTSYAGVVITDNTTGAGALTDRSLQELQTLKVTNEAAGAFNLTNATPAATPGALPKVTSVTLAGANSTSSTLPSVTLGDLGQTSNAYNLTVTASGLRGGLTLGDLITGAGYTTTLDLKAKAGSTDTTINDVRVARSTVSGSVDSTSGILTGSVVIDGTNSTGSGGLSIAGVANDTIRAATVSIDLTGSKFGSASGKEIAIANAGGTSSIDGTTVTIKANASANAFKVGTINVGETLNFTSASLVATNAASNSTVSVGHISSSTDKALTVNLTGSLATDKFSITGMAQTSTVTLSGNLGSGGSDEVTFNGAARTTTTGAMTINASGLTSSGTIKADITAGSGHDTITGTTGNDKITGRVGGDVITGNGGSDTFWLINPSDSAAISTITRGTGTVAFTATDAGRVGYTFTSGDIFSTVGMDKILDFGAGDRVVTNAAAAATPTDKLVVQTIGSAFGVGTTVSGAAVTTSTAGYGATVGYDLFVRGTYSSSGNNFTLGSSGPDTLYLYDSNGATTDGTVHGIVLVGYRADSFVVTAASDGTTGVVGVSVA